MGPETILNLIKNEWNDFPINVSKFATWNHDWTLPKLQAHRGCHQDGILENSMSALAAAKDLGHLMAEIDVQVTRDGIPVVFHDFNLSRLLRLNVEISELSYTDLVTLGSFDRLQDVLLTSHRPKFLNIEIKSKNLVRFPLEDALVSMISSSGCSDSVIISSFNPWALLRVKFLDPKLTRALLVTDQPENWNLYYLRRMWTAPLIEPHMLNIRYSMLDSKLIAKLKNFNVLTSAWTVNEWEVAKNLLNQGVDSIISDTLLPENLT